ncbi:hypothetical protein ACNKHS_16530 [Shigella flexneri]
MLMIIDDDRIDLQPGEVIKKRIPSVPYSWLLAVDQTVDPVRRRCRRSCEMLVSTTSERQGRVIDHDQAGSMELKKRQGDSAEPP